VDLGFQVCDNLLRQLQNYYDQFCIAMQLAVILLIFLDPALFLIKFLKWLFFLPPFSVMSHSGCL
jgi:hypothetical protein